MIQKSVKIMVWDEIYSFSLPNAYFGVKIGWKSLKKRVVAVLTH